MASSEGEMAASARRGKPEEIRAAKQLERLTFFSDAVFAIAMTLLVVEVRLPHVRVMTDAALGQALLMLIPNYIGFLVSFLVLARFWAAHHTIMGLLKATTPRLLWTNLLLLLAVAFMPFPTAVISEYVQLRVGIGFYTAWLTLLGLLNHRLVKLASDPALAADDVDPAVLRQYVRGSWIPPVIGACAFACGMIAPLLAMIPLAFGSPLLGWIMRRKR